MVSDRQDGAATAAPSDKKTGENYFDESGEYLSDADNARVSRADGYAERDAAERMIADARQALGDDTTPITLGADKGYDAQEFIEACEQLKVVPHVAQNKSNRRSAVADEIAGSVGYALSQQKRKLIEQSFGWVKMVGRVRQVMVRGLEKVDQMFVLNMAAYNLVRMRSLGAVRPVAT